MDKGLEELAIEERNAYFKAWRAKNKGKVASYNRRYWIRTVERKLRAESENAESERK